MARPAFRAGAVHVRVSATSANLGPGFDAFGLALDLHDDVVAVIGEDGVHVDVAGEGEGDVHRGEQNLVVIAMRATFDALGGQPRGIEVSCANRIPHGRGLGSSAAAIVAGVLLARALVLGGDQALPDRQVLDLACRLEGHPDNVAACLLGGLTIACAAADGAVDAVRLEVDPGLTAVVFIPPTSASTKAARGALPATVAHADAAFNAARTALLIAALTGIPMGRVGDDRGEDGRAEDDRAEDSGVQTIPADDQLTLLAATQDRLHQAYRAPSMPDTASLVATLRANGIAAVVSGAGPSVLALVRGRVQIQAALVRQPGQWRADAMAIDPAGARVIPIAR